jgi:DHA3 family macrolide efflux protein-like MFS transporter
MDAQAGEERNAPPLAPSSALTGLRAYYFLLVAETVSLIGSQISGLAVSIAVFRQTGHATPLALVAFFGAAPAILLGGFAGAVADRFDRRTIMLVANVGFVVFSGLLLISFASGAFRLWRLYALALASSLFAAIEGPAFAASVAMLVPDHHRDRANAISEMTGPAANIAAPVIAGLLYAIIGVVGSILVDILSFAAAIAALLVVLIPMPATTDAGRALSGSIWRQAFDGFRYLRARPTLLGLSVYFSLVNCLAGGVLVLQTPYILARTGSSALLGLVMGGVGASGLAGALAMGAWGATKPRIHTILPGILIGGVFLAICGAARGALAIGACLALFAFVMPFVGAAATSILQAKVAPDVQGRVFSALGQVTALLMPLAYLAAGPLADRVFEPARRLALWRNVVWLVGDGDGAGIGLLFVAAGALTALLSLAVYALPSIRRMEATLPDYVAEQA